MTRRFPRRRPRVVHGNVAGKLSRRVYVCDRCGLWHGEKPKLTCQNAGCDHTVFLHFSSAAEARRFGELKLQILAGRIRDVELQPSYPLLVIRPDGKAKRIGVYKADFRYFDTVKDATVVEDVKGRVDTFMSKWKRRHAEAQYGVTINVVWS